MIMKSRTGVYLNNLSPALCQGNARIRRNHINAGQANPERPGGAGAFLYQLVTDRVKYGFAFRGGALIGRGFYLHDAVFRRHGSQREAGVSERLAAIEIVYKHFEC